MYVQMGKFLNCLFNKTLDFAESRLFKVLLVGWACIWLVMVPVWKLLRFYITHIVNTDSEWSFLWGVLFWILGAIVFLVGVFIINPFARYIGVDDK